MSSRPSNHHFGSSSSTSSAQSSASDSDSSSSSSGHRHSMDSIALPIASVEVLRCMRCARSVETTSTDDVTTMGMVRIAHNLYYCERCAKMHEHTRPWIIFQLLGARIKDSRPSPVCHINKHPPPKAIIHTNGGLTISKSNTMHRRTAVQQ
ncbi:hypothetical protein BKA59DRAFT_513871 [Fusarium tricinctum]|uniref:Uncharacterized protein n=1 Tax=Fusarium tricinctum TaxID=61284 RepID=A0A8K0RYP4_9HYPO|nr:hypothetical protein BKA59DRAFT_513871 [Fusarium tricinctum]